MTTINVASDFSRYPGGRFRDDGPFSGEQFRDDLLAPALADGPVTVEMDGALGYGSGFLEEAFGGLVRVRGFRAADLRERLTLVGAAWNYTRDAWQYITDADAVNAREDATA